MTKDELNEIAWRDFVMFAYTQPDAHAAFRGATGRPQRSKTNSVLDVMIDKAVGGAEDDKYMLEFVDWVTLTQWGEDCAPAC
jgi:menaquinone-dependent protoporphyrinogen IX oxidase